MWRSLDAWERTLAALMLAGVALRVAHVGGDSLASDAAWYATMGESLRRHGEFLVPWQSTPEAPVYTHHFPPLYPALLALFFLPAGPSLAAMQLANAVVAAGFVAVAFFTTRDLYGRRHAFVAGAFAATLPTLLFFDHEGLSETFVAMLFTLTIWAILKSLQEPRYIVLGGIFAGLGYLAKASMGPFFLLAGAAGFAWRFLYVRWAIFRDRWYLLGAFLFAGFVLPWAGRNLLRHGWPHWETQLVAGRALDALWADARWPLLVAEALGWALLVLLAQALPFLWGATRTLRDWRSDRTSGLLMAIVTPILVASFFIAGFSLIEHFSIPRSPHPARYAITPVVPLLWLAIRPLEFVPPAPAGAPSAGAHLPRRADALVVAGATVVALFLAFREPYFDSQTAGEVLVLLGGTALGLVLIGLSRLYAWEPLVRARAESEPTWRAVRRVLPRWAPFLAAGLFVVAWLLTSEMVPLILAAAAAALCATWRQRALVVAIVFLGWGLGGGLNAQAFDDAGAAVAQAAQPGDTVEASAGVEPMVWPYLPRDVRMLPADSNATWRVQRLDAPAPAGYATVEEFGKHAALGPASWLRLRIELALRGDAVGEPARTAALLHKVPPA